MDNDVLETTTKFKETIESNAYDKTIKIFVAAVLRTHESNDKLSTWAMGGSAAMAGLFLANIDKLQLTFKVSDVKLMLGLIVCSILCGIVQRTFSMKIGFDIKASEYARNEGKTIKDEFDIEANKIKEMSDKHNLNIEAKLELNELNKHFLQLFPAPLSWWMKAAIKRQKQNQIDKSKRELMNYIKQVVWLIIQLLFLLIFVIYSLVFM